MRVSIIDVEWYSKKSFLPNEKCMKISSYYKQQKVLVNFITNSFQLKMDYDLMYVVKENILTDFPDGVDLLNDKVILIGDGLRFYDRYQPDINDVMAACRPDYLLYPIKEENKMAKANIVQFFHNGKLLNTMQDYHNSYVKEHFTYIIDKDFWENSVEDISKCYKKLKFDHHIIFKFPINFDSLLKEKKKVEMLTSLKIDFEKIQINVTLNTIEQINEFLKVARKIPEAKRAKMFLTGNITYSGNHFTEDRAPYLDFHRYIMLIDELKQLHLRIKLIAPSRSLSPFWFHFEDLEGWTTYAIDRSFIDYMTWENRTKLNIENIQDYLSDPLKWSDDSTQRLMRLWLNYPELMEKVGYRTWGETFQENIDMLDIVKGKRIRKGE